MCLNIYIFCLVCHLLNRITIFIIECISRTIDHMFCQLCRSLWLCMVYMIRICIHKYTRHMKMCRYYAYVIHFVHIFQWRSWNSTFDGLYKAYVMSREPEEFLEHFFRWMELPFFFILINPLECVSGEVVMNFNLRFGDKSFRCLRWIDVINPYFFLLRFFFGFSIPRKKIRFRHSFQRIRMI